jgi:predicted Zn-dependent peptidase
VILDEIDSYRDQPVEALFDEFEERLFAGHPLATPVLGTPETVERITRETLVRFRERCYVPEGMVLSVVGSHRWEEVEHLADKYFGAAPARKLNRPRHTFGEGARFDVRRPMDSNQVHHLMGRVTVGGDHPDRMGLALLANLLGGPSMNNRLSLRVRERHGLAYNLECSYAPLTDTGVFSIYFGTDVRQHERAESLIFKELQNVCTHKLGVRQLHELKVQMLGHMALAQDSGHALMTGLGKSLLQFGRVEPMEVVFQEIERVTSEDLLRLANEVLPLDGLSHLAYLPGS